MRKNYIGKVEALEICFERGIKELPCKNREVLTVPPITENKPILIIGKDAQGFYVATQE